MAGQQRLLGVEEHVVVRTRTHGKALFWPAVLLVLVGGAVGAGSALIPDSVQPLGEGAVLVLGAALAIWWSVLPFLRWRTTTFTITDRRLMTRRGILTRTGVDIPLVRITDVSSQRSLSDRMLGCGTLLVQTAADGGAVALDDIPDVLAVQSDLTELLFADRFPG